MDRADDITLAQPEYDWHISRLTSSFLPCVLLGTLMSITCSTVSCKILDAAHPPNHTSGRLAALVAQNHQNAFFWSKSYERTKPHNCKTAVRTTRAVARTHTLPHQRILRTTRPCNKIMSAHVINVRKSLPPAGTLGRRAGRRLKGINTIRDHCPH